MTITTTEIEKRLNNSPSRIRDNIAQDIVTGATIPELKALDARAIFLLITSLDDGWNSRRDDAAKSRLKMYSQFKVKDFTTKRAVSLVKNELTVSANSTVQSHLDADIVKRIYKAENSRLSMLERFGVDGSTIGRGQLGQPAFTDVTRQAPKGFSKSWKAYAKSYYAAARVNSDSIPKSVRVAPKYDFAVPTLYNDIYKKHPLEDFVVSAYLALKMKGATKPSRSDKDAARFSVAIYHGMYRMVFAAQKATNDVINWAPIETYLRANGNADECDYVNEVVL